jgi:hypothetical protein
MAGRDMAALIFEITWNAGVRAELRVLRDNAVEVLATPIKTSSGRITLQWESNDQIDHYIDWELWAPGRTLKDLAAIAAWEHSEPSELASEDEAENVWADGGDL